MSVLPIGIARMHRGNLATVLRVERIYGIPVLLSGLSSLVLLKSELNILNHHLKRLLESLQKLYANTPSTVVHFQGGFLTAEALLHISRLSLLGMISRFRDNILRKIGINTLSSQTPPKKVVV